MAKVWGSPEVIGLSLEQEFEMFVFNAFYSVCGFDIIS